MAKPGYGKRTTTDQRPRTPNDFSLLPTRERYVAGFIDRLPDEAAMSVKQLAKQLPLYGQQAIGSALRAPVRRRTPAARAVRGQPGGPGPLGLPHVLVPYRAGQRVVERLSGHGARPVRGRYGAHPGARAACGRLRGRPSPAPWVPQEPPPPDHEHPDAEAAPDPVSVPQQRTKTPPAPPQAPAPEPPHAPGPSPAYLALAQLGQVDHRVGLSAADCAALEGLAAAWLERGVTAEYVVHALTAGLPQAVDSPVGFVRRRLETKMPPHQPTAGPAHPPPPGTPAPRVLVECAECGAPGRPEALPDGLCRPCRSGTDAPEERTRDDGLPGQSDIATYVSKLRNRLKLP